MEDALAQMYVIGPGNSLGQRAHMQLMYIALILVSLPVGLLLHVLI